MEKFLYLDQQRIGRLQFFLGGLKAILIAILCSFVFTILGFLIDELHSGEVMFVGFPYAIIRCMQCVRRFHDLGKSGWNCLWFLCPFAFLIIFPYLYFFFGEEKTNQYGQQVVFKK